MFLFHQSIKILMVTCANYENNCFRSLLFIKNSILNIDSLQGIDAIMIIDMINFTMQVRWALWSYSLWMLHYSSLCKGLIMWSLNINLGSWDFWYHRASFVLVMKKSLQIKVRWAVQSKSLLLDPQSYLPYSNMLIWCIYMLHSFHSMFTLCVLSLTENE